MVPFSGSTMLRCGLAILGNTNALPSDSKTNTAFAVGVVEPVTKLIRFSYLVNHKNDLQQL